MQYSACEEHRAVRSAPACSMFPNGRSVVKGPGASLPPGSQLPTTSQLLRSSPYSARSTRRDLSRLSERQPARARNPDRGNAPCRRRLFLIAGRPHPGCRVGLRKATRCGAAWPRAAACAAVDRARAAGDNYYLPIGEVAGHGALVSRPATPSRRLELFVEPERPRRCGTRCSTARRDGLVPRPGRSLHLLLEAGRGALRPRDRR